MICARLSKDEAEVTSGFYTADVDTCAHLVRGLGLFRLAQEVADEHRRDVRLAGALARESDEVRRLSIAVIDTPEREPTS